MPDAAQGSKELSPGLTLITCVKGIVVFKIIYDYAALLNGLKSNY